MKPSDGMPPPFLPPTLGCQFVGRNRELEFLEREIHNPKGYSAGAPIAVVGEPGVGKSKLVSECVYGLGVGWRPVWISCKEILAVSRAPEFLLRPILSDMSAGSVVVVFDGADEIPRDALVQEFRRVTNYKIVRSVILTSRSELGLRGERILRLDSLAVDEARKLITLNLPNSLTESSLSKILTVVKGNPLAISLFVEMAGSMDQVRLQRVLEGRLFDLDDEGTRTRDELVAIARPVIVSANEAMIEALKKQPGDIFKLTPRQYEELVAELMHDMGFDVKLTKATRDGGKDILASIKTEVGSFLCLVEAKHYRADRVIGVSLARGLYGTLCDYQANSAMMVTTSSYSKDACDLQKKHEYQLSLRDYTDVAGWIQKYGTSRRGWPKSGVADPLRF